MPTITPKMEAAEYRLTGITRGSGNCDRCARELTQRVFAVTHKVTGDELFLGRRCAARATGYPTNAVERQVMIALRTAEVERRRAIVAEAFPESAAAEYPAVEYHLFWTSITEDMFWGGRRDGEWRDYLVSNGAR